MTTTSNTVEDAVCYVPSPASPRGDRELYSADGTTRERDSNDGRLYEPYEPERAGDADITSYVPLSETKHRIDL